MVIPKWSFLILFVFTVFSASASDDVITEILKEVTQNNAETILEAQNALREYLIHLFTNIRYGILHFDGYNAIIENIIKGLQLRDLDPLKIIKDRSFYQYTTERPPFREIAKVIYNMQGCDEANEFSISRWESVLKIIPHLIDRTNPVPNTRLGTPEFSIMDRLDRPLVNFALMAIDYKYLNLTLPLTRAILSGYRFPLHSADLDVLVDNVNGKLVGCPFPFYEIEVDSYQRSSSASYSATMGRILSMILYRCNFEPQLAYQVNQLLSASKRRDEAPEEETTVGSWLLAMNGDDYPEDIIEARNELVLLLQNNSLEGIDASGLVRDMEGRTPTEKILGLLAKWLALPLENPAAHKVHAIYPHVKLRYLANNGKYLIPETLADVAFLLNSFLTVNNEVNPSLIQQINEIFQSKTIGWEKILKNFDFSKYSKPRSLVIDILRLLLDSFELPTCYVITVEIFLKNNLVEGCKSKPENQLQLKAPLTPIVALSHGSLWASESLSPVKNCTEGNPIKLIDPECLVDIIESKHHADYIIDLLRYHPAPAEMYPYPTRYAIFKAVLENLKTKKYKDEVSDFVISQAILRLPLNRKANYPPTFSYLCLDEIADLEKKAPPVQSDIKRQDDTALLCQNVIDPNSLLEAVNENYDKTKLREILFLEPILYEEYKQYGTREQVLKAVVERRKSMKNDTETEMALLQASSLTTANGQLPPIVVSSCSVETPPAEPVVAPCKVRDEYRAGVITSTDTNTYSTDTQYHTVQQPTPSGSSQTYNSQSNTETLNQNYCSVGETLTAIVDSSSLFRAFSPQAPEAKFIRNKIKSYIIPVVPGFNYTTAEVLRDVLDAIKEDNNDPRVAKNVAILKGFVTDEGPGSEPPGVIYACLPDNPIPDQSFRVGKCSSNTCSSNETIVSVIDPESLFDALGPYAPNSSYITKTVATYIMPVDPSKNYKKGEVLRSVLQDMLKNGKEELVVKATIASILPDGPSETSPDLVAVCFPKAYLGGSGYSLKAHEICSLHNDTTGEVIANPTQEIVGATPVESSLPVSTFADNLAPTQSESVSVAEVQNEPPAPIQPELVSVLEVQNEPPSPVQSEPLPVAEVQNEPPAPIQPEPVSVVEVQNEPPAPVQPEPVSVVEVQNEPPAPVQSEPLPVAEVQNEPPAPVQSEPLPVAPVQSEPLPVAEVQNEPPAPVQSEPLPVAEVQNAPPAPVQSEPLPVTEVQNEPPAPIQSEPVSVAEVQNEPLVPTQSEPVSVVEVQNEPLSIQQPSGENYESVLNEQLLTSPPGWIAEPTVFAIAQVSSDYSPADSIANQKNLIDTEFSTTIQPLFASYFPVIQETVINPDHNSMQDYSQISTQQQPKIYYIQSDSAQAPSFATTAFQVEPTKGTFVVSTINTNDELTPENQKSHIQNSYMTSTSETSPTADYIRTSVDSISQNPLSPSVPTAPLSPFPYQYLNRTSAVSVASGSQDSLPFPFSIMPVWSPTISPNDAPTVNSLQTPQYPFPLMPVWPTLPSIPSMPPFLSSQEYPAIALAGSLQQTMPTPSLPIPVLPSVAYTPPDEISSPPSPPSITAPIPTAAVPSSSRETPQTPIPPAIPTVTLSSPSLPPPPALIKTAAAALAYNSQEMSQPHLYSQTVQETSSQSPSPPPPPSKPVPAAAVAAIATSFRETPQPPLPPTNPVGISLSPSLPPPSNPASVPAAAAAASNSQETSKSPLPSAIPAITSPLPSLQPPSSPVPAQAAAAVASNSQEMSQPSSFSQTAIETSSSSLSPPLPTSSPAPVQAAAAVASNSQETSKPPLPSAISALTSPLPSIQPPSSPVPAQAAAAVASNSQEMSQPSSFSQTAIETSSSSLSPPLPTSSPAPVQAAAAVASNSQETSKPPLPSAVSALTSPLPSIQPPSSPVPAQAAAAVASNSQETSKPPLPSAIPALTSPLPPSAPLNSTEVAYPNLQVPPLSVVNSPTIGSASSGETSQFSTLNSPQPTTSSHGIVQSSAFPPVESSLASPPPPSSTQAPATKQSLATSQESPLLTHSTAAPVVPTADSQGILSSLAPSPITQVPSGEAAVAATAISQGPPPFNSPPSETSQPSVPFLSSTQAPAIALPVASQEIPPPTDVPAGAITSGLKVTTPLPQFNAPGSAAASSSEETFPPPPPATDVPTAMTVLNSDEIPLVHQTTNPPDATPVGIQETAPPSIAPTNVPGTSVPIAEETNQQPLLSPTVTTPSAPVIDSSSSSASSSPENPYISQGQMENSFQVFSPNPSSSLEKPSASEVNALSAASENSQIDFPATNAENSDGSVTEPGSQTPSVTGDNPDSVQQISDFESSNQGLAQSEEVPTVSTPGESNADESSVSPTSSPEQNGGNVSALQRVSSAAANTQENSYGSVGGYHREGSVRSAEIPRTEMIEETTEIYYAATEKPEVANIVLPKTPAESIGYMHKLENSSFPVYELLKWPIILRPKIGRTCYDKKNNLLTSPVVIINITSLFEVLNGTDTSELDEYLTATHLTSLDTYYKLFDFAFENPGNKENFLRNVLGYLLPLENRPEIREPMTRIINKIPESISTPLRLGLLCNERIYRELPRYRNSSHGITFTYMTSKPCPSGLLLYSIRVSTDAEPPPILVRRLDEFSEVASRENLFEDVDWKEIQTQKDFADVIIKSFERTDTAPEETKKYISDYLKNEMITEKWKMKPVVEVGCKET